MKEASKKKKPLNMNFARRISSSMNPNVNKYMFQIVNPNIKQAAGIANSREYLLGEYF